MHYYYYYFFFYSFLCTIHVHLFTFLSLTSLIAAMAMSDVKTAEMISGTPNPEDLNTWDFSEYFWIQDQNNMNYNTGIVTLSTVGNQNLNEWIDWRSSFIVLPYTITTTGTQAIHTGSDVALKNSYYSLVDRLDMTVSGVGVTQNQNMLGVMSEYRLKTELSNEKLQRYGPIINYALDSPAVQGLIAPNLVIGGASGLPVGGGYVNNIMDHTIMSSSLQAQGGAVSSSNAPGPVAAANVSTFPTLDSPAIAPNGESCNRGMVQRAQWLHNYSFRDAGPQAAQILLGLPAGGAQAGAFSNNTFPNGQTFGVPAVKSAIIQNSCAVVGAGKTYTVYAYLPLRYLHHFFECMPICRNVELWMRLTINQLATIGGLVAAAGSIRYNATANMNSLSYAQAALTSGSTCPIMLGSSSCLGIGANFVETSNGTLNLTSTIGTPNGNPVRLYLRKIRFKPQIERLFPTPMKRVVRYLDHLVYTYPNNPFQPGVNGVNQLNWLITNSARSVRKIILYAYAANNNNSGTDATLSLTSGEPYHSSFTTWSNVQLLCSGQAIHSQLEIGSVEVYNQELRFQFLNGDEDNIFSSGQITYEHFVKGMTPMVFDLTKSNAARLSDQGAMSFQLLCNLYQPYCPANYTVNLVAFVLYERLFAFNADTGQATDLQA